MRATIMLSALRPLVATLFLTAVPLVGRAQQLAGHWMVQADNGQVVNLVLRQSAGKVSGTMTIGELRLVVAGKLEAGQVNGTISLDGNTEIFLARLEHGRLVVTNIPYDTEGQPDRENATELAFTRTGGGGEQPSARAPAPTPTPTPAPRSSGRAGTTDNTAIAREWAARIRGQRLYQSNRVGGGTAGGGVFERFLYICSNGRFVYRESGGVSVDVGSASGGSVNRNGFEGTWRVITMQGTAVVELTHDDGEVGQFSLVHQNGANYANGERVYITPDNDICD
jgi:hypothetical protein